MFDVFRAARDAWLAWPSKVAPFIAAELGIKVDAVAVLLAEYVYHQLRELGEPKPDFTDCRTGSSALRSINACSTFELRLIESTPPVR